MSTDSLPPEGVAIIGLAGRFPGARDVRELWQNLCAGTESITHFTDEELLASGLDPAAIADPHYVRARGTLADADKFDAPFFGFTPRDAELTDPQHRVFLECAWHALEDAALDPARFRGSIGVFAGSSLNTYFLDNIGSQPGALAEFVPQFQIGSYPLVTGTDKDYLATKLSYRLDLRGPSITVQTACSTSLVAVTQAVNALLGYQCDAALAGGVSITFPQARGHLYQEGAIASADGHCRSFDADARGTIFSHGCGVVVLKRLADALADGDPIYAVIKGAAVNNDGGGKVSFTAPSVDGQAEVIALAHALAGVTADTIGYVEAHGTATPLGDPIEVAALTKAFRATSEANGTCLLGTAKTNLGHLESAAGVTGLIKTALALRHAQIPASLHFEKPNPGIDFANSPFRVVTQLTEWKPAAHPRRAGVSSFGVGGTNAHVVVEEAPVAPVPAPVSGPQLIVLSAKTRLALETMTSQLAEFLAEHPDLALADVALTLQTGRRAFEHRLFLVATDLADAAKQLRRRNRRRVFTAPLGRTEPGANDDALTALGHRWLAGEEPDWTALHAGTTARRISLPGYAFARQRHWIEPDRTKRTTAANATETLAPEPAGPPPEPVSLFEDLTAFLAAESGLDLRAATRETSLLELGFDSLFLSQLAVGMQRKYGLRLTLRQLLGDLGALGPLADHIEANRTKSSSDFSPKAPADGLKSKLLSPAPSAPTGQHGPFRPVVKELSREFTPAQQEWLTDFIARYNARTAKSKLHTQKHRAHFADPRAVAGFKQVWKEMVYPIVVERSEGAHFWDLDGNKYVDTTQGFGLALFGHQAPFVMRAIEEQMRRGMEIGPSHPLAGEVAELLCGITGHERATFCNTGSEAILGAIRVARTYSGRNKMALFAGAYHGINDEVLVRPLTVNGEWRTAPIAPGILQDAVENVLVLDYGNPESLDILRRDHADIACILVESVQSRRPDLQPREFLHALRALCTELGIALIMDEVITGFRTHLGGAQAWFGVKGDLAAYGKVIGGGLPIGAIAGRAEYMDIFDGGAWQFGDDSSPPSGVTFFAGTFVRHPLALAAAKAVLLHLKEQGPALQTTLAERATAMIREIAGILAGTPFDIPHFGSVYYLRAHDFPYSGLFYALLRHRGIHIWEARPCFLGTAHTDEDIAKTITAFREAVAEMREAGFFPPAPGALPLGEAQRELWLAAQLGPAASSALNESCTLHFRGPFDEGAMRRAIAAVVARHDALRTRFDRDSGAQTVAPTLTLEVPSIQLDGHPEADARFAALLVGEAERVFDLEHGPLVVMQIVRLAPEHHALVFTAHHIACDGWSYDIVLRELGALYSAFRAGQPIPLPPAMQFAEYLRWETAQRRTPEATADAEFWLAQYATLPSPLDLPTPAPRPPARTFGGDRAVLTLPAELREAIAKLGAQNGTTLFATLLAGYAALLHRLTGQDDLVIGIPAAGQNLADGHDLVGHCANLLPLRLKLDAAQPFAQLVKTARRTVLDAMDHQAFTFGTLLQKLNVPRDTGRVPLVPVIFNLDPELSAIRFDGLAHEISLNPRRHYQFDLGFNIVDESGPLRVECDYNAELFDAATINRWLGHYRTLLEAAVATPTESLARLPLLTATERTELLETWNRTERAFPGNETLAEIFGRVAAQRPDSVALVDGETRLTYAELDACANAAASVLQARGVVAGNFVALPAERSARFVIGLLAILKAGGAYVPLDPAEPVERRAAMRSQCSDELDLATLPPAAAQPSAPSGAQAGGPAYVLFTSGTTGVPKGVVVPHRAVSRLVVNNDFAPFAAEDRVAFASNVCFDAATFEIWGALLNGGTLVVTPRDVLLSPAALSTHLSTQCVSVLFLTTSLFNSMALAAPAMFADLRHVVFGGEAADGHAVQKVVEAGKPQRLVNGYGPTETTTFAVCHDVLRSDGERIPIGRPIANTTAYILDAALQPVPVGISGELHIGGPGVAIGYAAAPDLTAARFLETPYGRLYKTGDLARWRADGVIEYLGRADEQVKIRGFRIEPGEIESALRQHPGVSQCAVVVNRAPNGDGTLHGYIVRSSGAAPSDSDLSTFLHARLPAHMIPASFTALDTLPLNHNGKLDTAALPPPAQPAPAAGTGGYAPNAIRPRTALESDVSRLWAELLGRNSFSVDDDFFAVGGHSLLALQFIAQVRQRFGVDVPVNRLFDGPTIEGLARFIEEHLPPPPPAKPLHSLITIQRGEESRRPVFLIPGGWGAEIEFLVYAQLKQHLGADLPIYGLKARGSERGEAPHKTVREMVVDYVDEIRTRQPRGPYLLVGECIGGVIAYEMARRLEELGEKVGLLALLDTERPNKASLRQFCAEERAKLRQRRWEVRVAQPLREHMARLAQLPLGGKLGYIWQRTIRKCHRTAPTDASPTPLDTRKALAHYPRLLMAHPIGKYEGKLTLLIDETSHNSLGQLGWDKTDHGPIEIHVLPGNHLSYIRENAATAAAKLRELIDRASAVLV
jgi:amino acid adenylation domain-containing protein